ncbi:hypothetical protein BH23THE1_BH23THE1_30900 [soil metagenome]
MKKIPKGTVHICIPLGMLVIIGNSLAPPDLDLNMTFSEPLNEIILVIGGYMLWCSDVYRVKVNTYIMSGRLTYTINSEL